MKPLDALLHQVLPRANHCPEPIALDAIRTAAIEFCERTNLWRSNDKFKVHESACGHDIVCTPYGAVLHRIESAWFDGVRLEPVSIGWLDNSVPGWRTHTGVPGRYITQVMPNSVRVVPAGKGDLELSILLKPAEDAEEIPSFLIDLYASVLVDGALLEILSIPGQQFTSLDLAQYHGARFQRSLDRLSSQGVRGQQRAPIRTKPQFF